MKKNGEILSLSHLIKIDDLENGNHQFILNPYLERFSQSETYFQKAQEVWEQSCQARTETNSKNDDLQDSTKAWREKYDKGRMLYYLLKDLDYEQLNPIKEQIIHFPDTIMSK